MDKTKQIAMRSYFAIVFVLCACSSNPIVTPEVTEVMPSQLEQPPLFTTLSPSPREVGTFQSRVCIYLRPIFIWEQGNTADLLRRQIDSTFQLVFNDNLVSRLGYPIAFGGEELVLDKNTSVLIPNFAQSCIKVDMKKGLNKANIQVTSTAGKMYSYSWYFRADNVLPYDNDEQLSLMLELSKTATFQGSGSNTRNEAESTQPSH